ncbi:MAG: xanthine phosphoribosyltransferase, partial [Oscillospiraceae bacterium]|nr:xanthine phosphoribosyltransferase [Oscillospiraceae bacterium]
VLKINAFINHRLDPQLIMALANEWKRLYEGANITKVLTIEASGIALAVMTGYVLGVPAVFAKKSQSINLDPDVYSTKIWSYTHQRDYDVIVAKNFLTPDDHVLIIDDVLANGAALEGLIEIVRQSGATLEGVGIAVEKDFQPGGAKLRAQGVRIESLAVIESMDCATGEIKFKAN